MIITEYLRETKKLNYFSMDENGLESIDHLMMEVDFFVIYVQQFYLGFIKKMTVSDRLMHIPYSTVKSWFVSVLRHLVASYLLNDLSFYFFFRISS